MTEQYDVAIVGGGHNGLVAAAYLAKSVSKVIVVEAGGKLGGAAGTAEFHPGYSVSECAHLLYALHPDVVRDLGLESCGLDYAARNLETVSLSARGDHVTLTSDTVSGTGLSSIRTSWRPGWITRPSTLIVALSSLLVTRCRRRTVLTRAISTLGLKGFVM